MATDKAKKAKKATKAKKAAPAPDPRRPRVVLEDQTLAHYKAMKAMKDNKTKDNGANIY